MHPCKADVDYDDATQASIFKQSTQNEEDGSHRLLHLRDMFQNTVEMGRIRIT
jgi:hypothetical protein